jgi:hypothetical protein
MSTTTKSPRKLAAAAYHIERDTLPEHNSRYSPKKFTQSQLMVCLALKTFFDTDYRGFVQILDYCPNLCKVFELKTVPHFTTLQKATKRLLKSSWARKFIESMVRVVMAKRKVVKLTALDSTGFQSGHISFYFLKRRYKSKKQPDDLVVESMAADAGYDSEANHQHAKQTKNIKTIIPPKIGKPTDKLPKGKYRRKMKLHWDRKSYGQCCQVETVFSMIK